MRAHGEQVIFDVPLRPGCFTSVGNIILRLGSCLWTGMDVLPKTYTLSSRLFGHRQPPAGVTAISRFRANLTFDLRVAFQTKWGLSPMDLWARIICFTCWLSQRPIPQWFNFKITAPDVCRRPAKYSSQLAP